MDELISVILCAYNAESYISQALASIKEQTYYNIEIIIIDDGSTDRTSERIIDFINDNPCLNVNFIRQENIGLTKSLNKAIKVCNGDYIARMDADDISLPGRLKISLEYIKNNNLDMVSTKAIRFVDSRIIDQVPRINKNLNKTKLALMKFGNPFIHGSFLIKSDVFAKLKYNEKFSTAQDFEFICNMIKNGYKVGYINIPLYKVRIEPNSLGRKVNSNQAKNALQIAKIYFGTDFFMIIKYKGFFKILLSMFKRLYI